MSKTCLGPCFCLNLGIVLIGQKSVHHSAMRLLPHSYKQQSMVDTTAHSDSLHVILMVRKQQSNLHCFLYNFQYKKGTGFHSYLTLLLALLLAIFYKNVMTVLLKHAYIHVLFLFAHNSNSQTPIGQATLYKYTSDYSLRFETKCH